MCAGGYRVPVRAIPETFQAAVVREIDARLDHVETSYGVRIPWAIESGSRAWGFPSPDSDYDARFIYVRSVDDYLTPWRERDVIETPLDHVYDVNGWDVAKAVELLVRGNATVVEWLRSPYVYRGDDVFRGELLALADHVVDRPAIGRHYTHVGRGQWDRYGHAQEMPLKRLFYALRPAASIRWLEAHPTSATPPMDLSSLLSENGASEEVVRLVRELVAVKADTREMGVGRPPAALLDYVRDALEHGAVFEAGPERDAVASRDRAADVFRHLVRAFGPG